MPFEEAWHTLKNGEWRNQYATSNLAHIQRNIQADIFLAFRQFWNGEKCELFKNILYDDTNSSYKNA